MNLITCSGVSGFSNQSISNSAGAILTSNELKYLLKQDETFKCLHKRIENGAILDIPRLKIFKCKDFALTLLNYTNKEIRFNDDGFLYFKEGDELMEFDEANSKVIAYCLEDNSKMIFFELNNYITERFYVEETSQNLFKLYLCIPNQKLLPQKIFAKNKEHQAESISLLINASKVEDSNSIFNNSIPNDIITAIFGRYEDALKKEFPSQYRG